jgi:hypothetical protein
MSRLTSAETRNQPHGTVFVAGSLHGPVELPAPMDRVRTHSFAPLLEAGLQLPDLGS